MGNMLKKILFASCGVIALGSCGSTGGGSNSTYDTQDLPFGQLTAAPFAINNNPLDRIDLLSMIDPENRRAALRSEGLCNANNVSPPRVRGYSAGKTAGAVETYIETLRNQYRDLVKELEKEKDDIKQDDLRVEIARLASEIYNLERDNPKDPRASIERRNRSLDDIRREYLAQRYQAITDDLIELDTSKKEDKKRQRDLLEEKKSIESEAAALGDEIKGDNNTSPSIELNCAIFAFYTYYLSYPQFSFAINDLSFYLDNDYLNLKMIFDDLVPDALETPYNDEREPATLSEQKTEIEKYSQIVASMSEFEQQRLKGYLSNGLYDKFYEQASRSIAISMRRNSIQDSIMVHSEHYCRYFKARLHDTDIKVNLALGIASTALSGLATIFTDPTTVRALAGAGAIVSGSQSRYNEVMFANLAVQTVIAGIDLSRERILRDINSKRFFPLDKDDIDEFKSLDNDGVLNPGMFNTYGLRASIEWDRLYNEKDGKLTYAGAPVELTRDKLGNRIYKPSIFSFSDLVERASFQEEEAGAASEEASESENKPPVVVNDEGYETTEDKPIVIDVLKNDSDPEDDELFILKAKASHGTAVPIEDDGKKGKKLKYTPNPNFHGDDVIRYWVTDIAESDEADQERRTKMGFVEIRVIPDGNEPPAKKYLGLASVGVYSVEAAMRDSIRFQTSCSLAAGLTEATKAMEEARAPSVRTLTDSLKEMEKMMRATEQLRDAIDDAAKRSNSGSSASGAPNTE